MVYCIKLEINYVFDKIGFYIDLDKLVFVMFILCMFLYLFFF